MVMAWLSIDRVLSNYHPDKTPLSVQTHLLSVALQCFVCSPITVLEGIVCDCETAYWSSIDSPLQEAISKSPCKHQVVGHFLSGA